MGTPGGTQFVILYGIHISKLPIYIYIHKTPYIYLYDKYNHDGKQLLCFSCLYKKTEITVTDHDVNGSLCNSVIPTTVESGKFGRLCHHNKLSFFVPKNK